MSCPYREPIYYGHMDQNFKTKVAIEIQIVRLTQACMKVSDQKLNNS